MIEMVLMTIALPAVVGGAILMLGLLAQWILVRINRPSGAVSGRPSALKPGADSRQPRAESPVPWPVMFAGAVGITLAFAISFRYTEGEWPLPPHTSWQWVFLMGITAGAVGAINTLIPNRWLPTVPRIAIVAIALGVIGAIMLRPLPPIEGDPAPWLDWMWKLGFGGMALFLWLGLETVSRREHAAWTLFALVAAFTAASVVIVEARFAKPSQLAGAMAAMCGIAIVISIVLALTGRRFPIHCGLTAPVAMILPALLVFGWFYNATDVPAASFVLTGLTPIALLVVSLTPLRKWGGWQGGLLRFAIVAILPAIAIALTMMMSEPPEPAGYEW